MIDNYPETHQQGTLSIENHIDVFAMLSDNNGDCDFGVQIAHDGRVWVCINGMAWLRFKPERQPATLPDEEPHYSCTTAHCQEHDEANCWAQEP